MNRRTHLLRLLLTAMAATSATTGCASNRPPPRQYTTSEQRMRAKFGDIGFELRVDAMKGDEFEGVSFYQKGIETPFYQRGGQTLRNTGTLLINGPVPEQVRIVWRDSAQHGREQKNGSTYSGKIIGDQTIEVGSRIPQDLINDLKRDSKGILRLKFRMSKEQGMLLGWDIERRPGYDPRIRDSSGEARYVAPVHSFVGGDFQEAKIYNGQVVRAGWYIDKKTGRKVETDH